MFLMRGTCLCLFLFALSSALAAKQLADVAELKRVCPEKCPLAWKCSPYSNAEDVVWTLLDGYCKLFNNGCMQGSFNCGRQNDCLPQSKVTTEEECKKHCIRSCKTSPTDTPVCGWFPSLGADGERVEQSLTFPNQCSLDNFACLNKKSYGYSSEGACS